MVGGLITELVDDYDDYDNEDLIAESKLGPQRSVIMDPSHRFQPTTKTCPPFLVNLFAEIWEKGWGVKGAETSLPVKSKKFVDQLIDLIEKIVGHREESLQGNSDHKDGQGHDSAESKSDVSAELSLHSFFSRAEDEFQVSAGFFCTSMDPG